MSDQEDADGKVCAYVEKVGDSVLVTITASGTVICLTADVATQLGHALIKAATDEAIDTLDHAVEACGRGEGE